MLVYADDTTLYCNINQNTGEELNNDKLMKLWEWLGANIFHEIDKIVFHTSKRVIIYVRICYCNSLLYACLPDYCLNRPQK